MGRELFKEMIELGAWESEDQNVSKERCDTVNSFSPLSLVFPLLRSTSVIAPLNPLCCLASDSTDSRAGSLHPASLLDTVLCRNQYAKPQTVRDSQLDKLALGKPTS